MVSKGEKIEEIYYQNFQRSTRVAFHDSKCSQKVSIQKLLKPSSSSNLIDLIHSKETTKVCTDTTLFGEQTSGEERIYEFFHAESGTFGPTALWAHIKDSLEVSTLAILLLASGICFFLLDLKFDLKSIRTNSTPK